MKYNILNSWRHVSSAIYTVIDLFSPKAEIINLMAVFPEITCQFMGRDTSIVFMTMWFNILLRRTLVIKANKKTSELKQSLDWVLQLLHWNYANRIVLIPHMLLSKSWCPAEVKWLILSCSKTYDNRSGYVCSYSQ